MISNYYDQLSPHYQNIHQDWNESVQRQAEILDGVIREHFNGSPLRSVLDAAAALARCVLAWQRKAISWRLRIFPALRLKKHAAKRTSAGW